MALWQVARVRSGRGRRRALVLAIVLLGGGFGLPAVDALLYHTRAPDAHALQPQLADTGSPLGHAFRCTLDNALPGPRLAAALLELPRLARLERNAGAPPPAAAPRAADHYHFPQPRSPPAALA